MKSSATSSARPSASERPEGRAGGADDRARLRRRPQLSEEVAAHLRHLIMTADFRPGEYIRLDETAERLGVSVTPVREALLTLRGEGMVSLEPHRGYRVSDLDRIDVDDLFWLQGEIAVKLALRTAEVITSEEIADLEWCNQKLRSTVASGDTAAIIDAEFEFHRRHNVIAAGKKLAWFLLGGALHPHPALRLRPGMGRGRRGQSRPTDRGLPRRRSRRGDRSDPPPIRRRRRATGETP